MQAGAGRRRRIPRDAIEAEGRGGSIDAAEGGSVPAGSGGMGTFPRRPRQPMKLHYQRKMQAYFALWLVVRASSSFLIGLDGKPEVKGIDIIFNPFVSVSILSSLTAAYLPSFTSCATFLDWTLSNRTEPNPIETFLHLRSWYRRRLWAFPLRLVATTAMTYSPPTETAEPQTLPIRLTRKMRRHVSRT